MMYHKILGKLSQVCLIAAVASQGVNCAPAKGGDGSAPRGDQEDRCLAAMQAVFERTDVSDYFGTTIAIGPGLVHASSGDQAAFPFGRPMLIMFREEQLYFLGRFVKAEDGTLESFLRSAELKSVLESVLQGSVRPASQDENDLFNSLVPYEADGQTVTVIQDGSQRLLLDVDEDGRVFWMDMISEYPIPSVADSMEEAMKLTKQIGERATGSDE